MTSDLGMVASTKQLIQRLKTQAQQEEAQVRCDWLISTPAVLTAPQNCNPTPLNQDGIEKCFGISVVVSFMFYRQAHASMRMKPNNPNENENKNPNRSNDYFTATSPHPATLSSSPLISNARAVWDGKSEFDRKLVWSLATPLHFLNDTNCAVGN